jgi:hypothetical protein
VVVPDSEWAKKQLIQRGDGQNQQHHHWPVMVKLRRPAPMGRLVKRAHRGGLGSGDRADTAPTHAGACGSSGCKGGSGISDVRGGGGGAGGAPSV